MRRREFIKIVAASAAAWPLVVRAQQSGRMPLIGVLMNRAENDPDGQARLAAFLKGLQGFGLDVGRNVRMETRWGADDVELERKYAAEVVALAPDVILASGGPSVAALQHISRTLPIVFAAVVDPVGAGFVDSLAQPGGNVTGFLTYEYSLGGKWLELRAGHGASGSPSGSRRTFRKHSVRRDPKRCAITRCGGEAHHYARCRRD